jgi:acetyl esterase/lipase
MSITQRKPTRLDVSDTKWSHPECVDLYHFGEVPREQNPFVILTDPEMSHEEKLKLLDSMDFSTWGIPVDESKADVETYMVPGCPEEPNAPETKVWVYTPKGIEIKEKMPTMFYCFGGGMTMCLPRALPIENFAVRYGCIIVATEYRNAIVARYPAAVNDCHAGYQWMIDNAEKLHVDPDNVILFGESTGGHLATCLPFRLMRYGYNPKGVVASVPITDDRESKPSSAFYGLQWDGRQLRRAYVEWMGPDNYASNTIGPEAFANHTTVEDCIGYPPLFLHSAEWDPSSDYDMEFASKVKAAHSFVCYHCWGGLGHNVNNLDGEDREYTDRIQKNIDADVMECFKHDLRRPWVSEL